MNENFESFLIILIILLIINQTHGGVKDRKIVALNVQKSRKEIDEFQSWKVKIIRKSFQLFL